MVLLSALEAKFFVKFFSATALYFAVWYGLDYLGEKLTPRNPNISKFWISFIAAVIMTLIYFKTMRGSKLD